MYVIKVGRYYVKNFMFGEKDSLIFIQEIVLSREIMRSYSKQTAQTIARYINGEVIKMEDKDGSN